MELQRVKKKKKHGINLASVIQHMINTHTHKNFKYIVFMRISSFITTTNKLQTINTLLELQQ